MPAGARASADPAQAESGRRLLVEALKLLARSCHAAAPSSVAVESMIDCLLGMFQAERGFILLAAGTSGADGSGQGSGAPRPLTPVVTRKVDIDGSDRYSHTVANDVFRRAAPRLIQDTSAEKDVMGLESVLAEHIRSIMAVPLLDGGAPAGVIYLDTHTRNRIFAPGDLELLEAASEHVMAALVNSRLRDRLGGQVARLERVVEQEIRREHGTRTLVGRSPAMAQVLRTLELLAPQETSVLILGESGTGKELAARALHEMSRRRSGPFVAVNCMALSPGTLESELFGHEKGAFTGASESRPGRFELADEGTIFLDEIGELDASIQVKLLRVLQERVVERVGSSRPRAIRVRLVCATNADLGRLAAAGKFREDLYYRIAVFPITLPPLRDRREDIPGLAEHFIGLMGKRMGRVIHGLTPEALEALVRYRWPGNIRELRNVIERALVIEPGDRIAVQSLPFGPVSLSPAPVESRVEPPRGSTPGRSLAEAREEFERHYILASLARHGQNVTRSADELSVPRSTIYRKLRSWGLDPKEET